MAERASGSGSAVAVIPARGGSKRIPRKNIRAFLGVPLLSRTVSLLREAALFERIVVSTDDEEIAAVGVAAGAEAPFRRPAPLSDDRTGTQPVIAHALAELAAQGARPGYVCCVYPAAVLALPADLRAAWDLIRAEDLDYVFAAASFPHPIQRALRKTAQGRCEMFWPEQRETRSQDLEPAFHDAGQFYFGRHDAWTEARPIFGPRSALLELPRFRVQDIDTEEDWRRAELIFQLLQAERGS
jgi:N-acylneuraminate cytidylyltransferase